MTTSSPWLLSVVCLLASGCMAGAFTIGASSAFQLPGVLARSNCQHMMTAPYAKIPGSFPNGRSCAIQRPGLIKPTRGSLSPRSSSEAGAEATPDPSGKVVDYAQLGQYVWATAAEVAIIFGVMFLLQQLCGFIPEIASQVLAGAFFLVMSVKSRTFAVLDASRPNDKGQDATMPKIYTEIKRPSWSPPGIVFPIVWSTIGLLRTISSFLIWEAMGRQFLVLPLMVMMVHLSIGDTWNYINNQQKLRGTSVAGVAFVWTSAASVVALYYQALPLAGKILAPSVVWLSIASCLIFSIWQLNGGGKTDPLLPMKQA